MCMWVASRNRSSGAGSAARPRDVTDRVVLASKGRFGGGQDVNAVGLSRRHLHRALNATPGRLGIETIDLYQLHASDMHTPVQETLSFLDEAVKDRQNPLRRPIKLRYGDLHAHRLGRRD